MMIKASSMPSRLLAWNAIFILLLSKLTFVDMVSAQSYVSWTMLTNDRMISQFSPLPRASASLSYCEGIDVLVLFGGISQETAISSLFNDVWLYSFEDGGHWSSATLQTDEPALPAARAQHASIILPRSSLSFADGDDKSCHIVIHGGMNFQDQTLTEKETTLDDLWILSIQPTANSSSPWIYSFSKPIQSTTDLPKKSGHALVSIGSDLYMYGGYSTSESTKNFDGTIFKINIAGVQNNSTMKYSFTANWIRIDQGITGEKPIDRASGIVVSDSESKSIIIYGGENTNTLSDIWILDTQKLTWNRQSGYEVQISFSPGIMYNNTIITYGGTYKALGSDGKANSYVYRDSTFTQISQGPSGISLGCSNKKYSEQALLCATGYGDLLSPEARYGHSMALRNGQILLFGGKFLSEYSGLWTVSADEIIAAGRTFSPSSSNSQAIIAIIAVCSVLFIVLVILFIFRKRLNKICCKRDRIYIPVLSQSENNKVLSPSPLPISIDVLPSAIYTPNMKVNERTLSPVESYYPTVPKPSFVTAGNDDCIDTSNQNICKVCSNTYEQGDPIKILPCSHYCHTACLETWIKQHNICPVCSKEVLETNASLPQVSIEQPPLGTPIYDDLVQIPLEKEKEVIYPRV